MTLHTIPISDARRLAKACGASRLLILATDGHTVTSTTYGQTREICQKLGEWADENAALIGAAIMEATE